MGKYIKTKADYERDFQLNLQSLQASCDSYDQGKDYTVLDIAVRLRVLLHDTDKSISLFKHLDLKGIQFLDTASPIDEKNMLADECLVYIAPDENWKFSKYYPLLDNSFDRRFIDFNSWWNQIVYRDTEKRFSRSYIVRNFANKMGGAHSGPDVSMNYYEFLREGSGAKTTYRVNGKDVTEPKNMDNLLYASLRQIAYEVLESLKNV